jgi:hypothetical protein
LLKSLMTLDFQISRTWGALFGEPRGIRPQSSII